MDERIRKLLFLNRGWPVRLWMWTSVASVVFYLVKFSFSTNPVPTALDMLLMTYGLGSIAAYVLIYGFDWS